MLNIYGRPTLGSWVAYFRPYFEDDPHVHIVAFLPVWLDQFPDQFVFSSSNTGVFPIATCLANGTRLALGPTFLGTFYCRLDQFSIDLR